MLVNKPVLSKYEWSGTKTPAFNLIYKKNSFTCVPTALHVTSKYHICCEFALYLWRDCALLRGAGVTAHPSVQPLAHREYCLAHRNHSVKVCRTEMSLSSFSGFSQAITKPPTTLGKQLSLTQGWRMYCKALWCFTLSHSSGRRDLQTDGRTVYSDYTGQHLTQITAIQGI